MAHALTEDVAWARYALTEVQFVLGDWDAAWESGLEALRIAEAHDYLAARQSVGRTIVTMSGA